MKVSYYRFERERNCEFHTRMVATSSTKDNSVLEVNRVTKPRKGRLFGALYLRYVYRPQNYGKSAIKSDYSVSIGDFNLSSVKPLNLSNKIAFGDVHYTNDAILFVLNNVSFEHGRLNDSAVIEMYIFEGQKNNQQQIAQRYISGDRLVVSMCEDAKRRATEREVK